jgi:hypothetical protein
MYTIISIIRSTFDLTCCRFAKENVEKTDGQRTTKINGIIYLRTEAVLLKKKKN